MYSPPLSLWNIDAGDVAAAHGGGHAQRGLGQRGVVMLAHREARAAAARPGPRRWPGTACLRRWGSRSGPRTSAGRSASALKSRLTRSGIGAAALSGRVRDRRLRFGHRPCEALAGHRGRHRLLRHLPAVLDEVLAHPGRPVGARRAARVVERRLHRRVEARPVAPGGRSVAGRATCRTTTRSPPSARQRPRGEHRWSVLWAATNDATVIASPP